MSRCRSGGRRRKDYSLGKIVSRQGKTVGKRIQLIFILLSCWYVCSVDLSTVCLASFTHRLPYPFKYVTSLLRQVSRRAGTNKSISFRIATTHQFLSLVYARLACCVSGSFIFHYVYIQIFILISH